MRFPVEIGPVPCPSICMHNNISPAVGCQPAVVLACAGAPEGDLNLVRSLGEQGVPVIVLGEYADPPSRYSRYCIEFVQVPDFGDIRRNCWRRSRSCRGAMAGRCRCFRRPTRIWRR